VGEKESVGVPIATILERSKKYESHTAATFSELLDQESVAQRIKTIVLRFPPSPSQLRELVWTNYNGSRRLKYLYPDDQLWVEILLTVGESKLNIRPYNIFQTQTFTVKAESNGVVSILARDQGGILFQENEESDFSVDMFIEGWGRDLTVSFNNRGLVKDTERTQSPVDWGTQISVHQPVDIKRIRQQAFLIDPDNLTDFFTQVNSVVRQVRDELQVGIKEPANQY
jgi:hypothetical protein